MDPYLKRKESVYNVYFVMKEYCDENYLPFLNKPGSLNLLYELNGVLNSPILSYIKIKNVNDGDEDEEVVVEISKELTDFSLYKSDAKVEVISGLTSG